MPSSCSIRALWILTNQDTVVFSRRFPVVEKRWRAACERDKCCKEDDLKYNVAPSLPTDSEIADAFVDRKKSGWDVVVAWERRLKYATTFKKWFAYATRKRGWGGGQEGSARGFGIRINQSVEGSDSWVDDPITRHIISLCTKNEEEKNLVLWPLVLHIKGHYCILVLPLVEPDHLKTYTRMCKRSDCGNAVGADESLSPLLLNLPSITGVWSALVKLFQVT
ncbi:hypothetical protein MTR67_003748 [Solanum verrucosum]|uniref:Uncharacterized protein n=1 Tax=Solanum verrucosum TaxID=315347 RepID=A0AAF0PSS2_SOLVR|nr:hypothetical protein MTR67_003748 [Solanum verrucosum]